MQELKTLLLIDRVASRMSPSVATSEKAGEERGLPRLGLDQLPRKVALELMFTGEPITSAEALKWGLINDVVPDGTELDAALALAERITVNAPLAVQASKRVAVGADDGVVAADEPGWSRTMREVATVFATEDAREGPLAFAQKRQPVWKAK